MTDLAGLLREEIQVCGELLHWTERAHAALGEPDAAALATATSHRAAALERLTALEQQAEPLRRQHAAPPQELLPLLDELDAVVEALRQAEELARRAGQTALATGRDALHTLTQGTRLFKGYRATRDLAPRFTDRKG